MVEVSLECERCGASYHGERPGFWVAKEGPEHIFIGYCAPCEKLRAEERAAFDKRTKLLYARRDRAAVGSEPEGEPNIAPAAEEDDGTPFSVPPAEQKERDEYWR